MYVLQSSSSGSFKKPAADSPGCTALYELMIKAAPASRFSAVHASRRAIGEAAAEAARVKSRVEVCILSCI